MCFKINQSETMMLFATNGHITWNYPNLKQLFTSVTNYKNKMGKGIISSFQNYDQVINVCYLYYSYTTIVCIAYFLAFFFCGRMIILKHYGSIIGSFFSYRYASAGDSVASILPWHHSSWWGFRAIAIIMQFAIDICSPLFQVNYEDYRD